MRVKLAIALVACALGCMAAPALADPAEAYDADGSDGGELLPYLQCVPYAREVTGIQIYGDAWTWWDLADGRYARGHQPRVGSVMAFQPYGNMTLGHVAAVSKVINSRTVLLRHANWSPIDGRRGQIEDNVEAVDVSPDNDWSLVRVWYAPIQDLGTTAWPVAGFIYPTRDSTRPAIQLAKADKPKPITPSRAFLSAFADYGVQAPGRVALASRSERKGGKPIDLTAQIASN